MEYSDRVSDISQWITVLTLTIFLKSLFIKPYARQIIPAGIESKIREHRHILNFSGFCLKREVIYGIRYLNRWAS
jgi:hypothetical protein